MEEKNDALNYRLKGWPGAILRCIVILTYVSPDIQSERFFTARPDDGFFASTTFTETFTSTTSTTQGDLKKRMLNH